MRHRVRGYFSWVVLPALLAALAWPALAGAAPPARELLGVLDFDIVGGSAAEASAVSDRVREEVLKTGTVTLVDRAQINAVLNEQALQQTGCTGQECAVRVGRILGVRRLVAGKVTKISDTVWQVSAQLIDVETAETLRATSVTREGRILDLLNGGIAELATKLMAVAAPVAASAPAVPPSAGFGRLFVDSDYSGEILLDGQRTGLRTSAVLDAVTAGPHTVTVVGGSRSAFATLVVHAGETVKINLKLAEGETTVSTNSTPPGAEVLLDGEPMGRTPAQFSVAKGAHNLEFRLDGYLPLKAQVTAGLAPLTVTGALQPESAVQQDYDTWNTERWIAIGATAVFVAYGAIEAQGVTESNRRQDDLKQQALATNDLQTRNSLLNQMNDERQKGAAAKQASDTSYGLAAVALGFVIWLEYRAPQSPQDASSVHVSALPGLDGRGVTVAAAWSW